MAIPPSTTKKSSSTFSINDNVSNRLRNISTSSNSNNNNTGPSHHDSMNNIRVVSQSVMNSIVTEKDSLYYICLQVKKRLEHLPQLQPYLNLAYSSSELLSERQSLQLSQKQQLYSTHDSSVIANVINKENAHRSVSSMASYNRDSHDGKTISNATFRSSSISANSLGGKDNDTFSLDGITHLNSSSNTNSLIHTDSNNYDNANETNLLTYAMGILPISMDCDPVTQLSQLFQQGSPLCIIFNAVKPQFKLPVVSSDDLKICKKSIYDFILGCKKHFAFNDEELFTISDVFSNSTNHFIKVIDVVQTLLNSSTDIFPMIPMEKLTLQMREKYNPTQALMSTDYNNIIKEFVITERKYIHDLEILDEYKQQLLDSNLITSEELYMLFPNLTEAIDFQRRFLISLEINSLVDPSKQRIGALFMHSKHFFKLYEPWSIGQNAAIDFLSNTLDKFQNMNFVLKNKLELQSFLYKPVQRLCKYPLLLKELLSAYNKQLQKTNNNNTNSSSSTSVSTSSSSSSSSPTSSSSAVKELEIALDISKKIAKSINENQRRTENHEVVKKLYGRVLNWKGYRIAKFGELLYFDKVFISTNNSNEQERGFDVYLFEKIIILFSEVNNNNTNAQNSITSSSSTKKSSSLILKKKNSTSSSSSTSILNSSLPSASSLALNNSTSANNNNNNSSKLSKSRHNSYDFTTSLMNSSNTSLHNSNNNNNKNFSHSNFALNEPKLDLRGRIMIMNLNEIKPSKSRSLNITWESIKEQGNFLLKFKNEETRDNWCSCLQSLVRHIKSESFRSTNSGDFSSSSIIGTPLPSPSTHRNNSITHNNNTTNNNNNTSRRNTRNSISSINSSHLKYISENTTSSNSMVSPSANARCSSSSMHQKKRVSNFENEHKTILEDSSYENSIPDHSILIRVSFNSDFYTILINLDKDVTFVIDSIKKN
ncbi:Rho family guanine nucleotide exchange factor CDC24 NDAI_0H01120 [Naumovozyma dairenensis CBS 421]|uniref:DH domain-containing protein n=1 Tax=Naumovozyma dairenensis (strain ATCC 10597 / BCRC 20456 / CBS 421 / NBRC 0211 / NRRL Y-12639) TaxID=1071378 RepID=G0WES5_NAUDC|nr:hypothetical protein NDAI_0H01120 [Naumovozyma dairenensis CBS 421]CCD26286.1 hypothetical protein NDAI_0H01120 [Naumovozyma dairenensis CBS 421]